MLLPQTDGDYANFLTHLMDSQHKMLQSVHGVDSPQVALSSSMIDLQSTVSSSVPLMSAFCRRTSRTMLFAGDLGACGRQAPRKDCTWCRTRKLHVPRDADVRLRMPLQVAGLTNNLTTEYNNFLNFLTTTPTAIQTLINDAKLLNAQLNAVRLHTTCNLAVYAAHCMGAQKDLADLSVAEAAAVPCMADVGAQSICLVLYY